MVGRFAGNAGAELILSPIHRNRFLLAYIQVGKEFFICLIWLHYSFLYLLYWAKLDFIHLVCIFICATKAEEPLSVPQYHINPCPAVSLMHHAEAAAAAALVSSSRSCLHTNKVAFLSYANQTKLTLHHYNCFYWLFYHNCQILDINIYIKADKWSRRAVYLSFLDLSSDVKEIDPLTSWKIVSPCPMVRCGGGCCCCWARRCFCLADWRHMVIISVHASIFARHSSRTSLAFLAPRGSRKIKSLRPAFCEQEAAGQQVWWIRSEATWAGTRGGALELCGCGAERRLLQEQCWLARIPLAPSLPLTVCYRMFTFFMIGACRCKQRVKLASCGYYE